MTTTYGLLTPLLTKVEVSYKILMPGPLEVVGTFLFPDIKEKFPIVQEKIKQMCVTSPSCVWLKLYECGDVTGRGMPV